LTIVEHEETLLITAIAQIFQIQEEVMEKCVNGMDIFCSIQFLGLQSAVLKLIFNLEVASVASSSD